MNKTATSRALAVLRGVDRHDRRGQLVEVLDAEGNTVEKYDYDRAGNLLAQTVNGQTTTFAYDEANQLVSKTLPDGTFVTFGYDAAGRLVREGDRHYAYGWLDKVLAVTGADGKTLAAYAYGLDNQLASATVGGATEEFLWDGVALVRRGAAGYLNEPHANGGSPILSSGGGVLFNDLLGSTLGTLGGDGYRPCSLTAFGDTDDRGAFFTGKPLVDGLGYAFLLRSYRPDHGKWLTADPLGYPDGWNRLAYCRNMAESIFDLYGATSYEWSGWNNLMIIGLNPETTGSGVATGDSVAILWHGTYSISCSECQFSDLKDYYTFSVYSGGDDSFQDHVWMAPQASVIKLYADNILDALGIPTDWAGIATWLINKALVLNLSPANVDSLALAQPSSPPAPEHDCEP